MYKLLNDCNKQNTVTQSHCLSGFSKIYTSLYIEKKIEFINNLICYSEKVLAIKSYILKSLIQINWIKKQVMYIV